MYEHRGESDKGTLALYILEITYWYSRNILKLTLSRHYFTRNKSLRFNIMLVIQMLSVKYETHECKNLKAENENKES